MLTYYVVTELQVTNGVPATLVYCFNDYKAAQAKYYSILAAACMSTLDLHGAFLTSSEGEQLKSEVFDNRVVPE